MGLLPLLLSITLGPTSAVPLAAAKADALPALASTLPASPDVARAAAGPDVSGKYFGARYYGSRIGRFTTVDPALDQEALLNPQKWNRYAYSRNNPLRYVDPDGRDDRGVMEIEQRQALARLGPGPTQLTPEQQRVEAIFRGWVFEPLLLLSGMAFGEVAAGLPGLGAGAEPFEVSVSRSRSPEAAAHIEAAQAAGHPEVVTLNRGAARPNRAASLKGTPRGPRGVDRDEYPPACCSEGGAGASVRPIPSSDNRSAGGQFGAQTRGLPDGAKVRITTKDQ
jgi:RHS repeat-associated protein